MIVLGRYCVLSTVTVDSAHSTGQFTLRDMYEQFQNIMKMGPINQIIVSVSHITHPHSPHIFTFLTSHTLSHCTHPHSPHIAHPVTRHTPSQSSHRTPCHTAHTLIGHDPGLQPGLHVQGQRERVSGQAEETVDNHGLHERRWWVELSVFIVCLLVYEISELFVCL